MATRSLFARPIHLLAVLWFVMHIPTTLLIDIQSSGCQLAWRCRALRARCVSLSAATARAHAAAHATASRRPPHPSMQQHLQYPPPTPGHVRNRSPAAVLPEQYAKDFPQFAKDMLQWHIKTHGDFLVGQPSPQADRITW